MNRELRVPFSFLSFAFFLLIVEFGNLHAIRPTNPCHAKHFTFECATGTGWYVISDLSLFAALMNTLMALSAFAFFLSSVLWFNKQLDKMEHTQNEE